jgi:hypothetical protein
VTVGVYFVDQTSYYVGCILEVLSNSHQEIIVNCFVNQAQLANPSLIVAGPIITKESCKYMTELFQTSERVLIASSDDVTDMAFVFKKEALIEADGTECLQRSIKCICLLIQQWW